jgi:3',5'-cyclic-AMP phosphodiesterase
MKRNTCILLIVVGVVWLGGCASKQQATHFYFVQMTDLHLGDRDHAQRAAACIDEINALPMKIDCVVVTGDMTMDNILRDDVADEARRVLGAIKAPVSFLPGNHDIDPNNLSATVAAYQRTFGPACSMVEHEGVVFLFVYTEPIRQGFDVPGLNIYEWVERELDAAKGKPVIIFHHSPSMDDFYKGRFHDVWKAQARERWHGIVESHKNVKAVIAGHFHRDEFHWIGDVPLYICPPVASYFGMVPSYRIYEYTDGKIGYRTEYPRMKAKADN